MCLLSVFYSDFQTSAHTLSGVNTQSGNPPEKPALINHMIKEIKDIIVW